MPDRQLAAEDQPVSQPTDQAGTTYSDRAIRARFALIVLGETLGATLRQCLPDVLSGWQRFCRLHGREDLLSIACPLPIQPIPLEAHHLKTWAYLAQCVALVAANLDALDSERHWQHAAGVMVQAAANAALATGSKVAHEILGWEFALDVAANGDDDEIDRELAAVDVEAFAQRAATAAHYGRIALGEVGRG